MLLTWRVSGFLLDKPWWMDITNIRNSVFWGENGGDIAISESIKVIYLSCQERGGWVLTSCNSRGQLIRNVTIGQ